MSEASKPLPGTIAWTDLTVPDAGALKDFYQEVVGWLPTEVSLGEYNDYCMTRVGGGAPVAGICHARGPNAGLPPVWLIYIEVADLEASLEACERLGGRLLTSIRDLGPSGRFCVIEDPSGAVAGVFQSKG